MYSPLTPLSFLERTAATFPDRIAVADEERRLTWAELRERVRRLAVALRSAGLEQGDRVAYPAPVLVMLTSDFVDPGCEAARPARTRHHSQQHDQQNRP